MKTYISELFNKVIKSDVFWLLLISMTIRNIIQLPYANSVICNPDTPSFCLAAKKIAMGIVDEYRTPLYSIFLNLCNLISSKHIFETAVIFQRAISFICIIPFYIICKKCFKYKPLAFIAALVYACQPNLLHMNHEIYGESLLASFTVIFIYIFYRFIKYPSIKRWIFLQLYVFLLIMLKPIGIVIYGAFFIATLCLMFFRNKNQKIIISIRAFWLGFALSFSLIIGFCSLNKIQNNFFGISTVNHDNFFANVVISGSYRTIPDERLISIIDSIKYMGHYYVIYHLNNDHEKYQECFKEFPSQYPLDNSMQLVKDIPANTYGYNRMNLTKPVIKAMMTKDYINYLLFDFTLISKGRFFNIPVRYIYFVFMLELVIIFIGIFKRKNIDWVRCILTLSAIALFFATIWGGIFDSTRQRVLTPIISLLVFMFFDCFNWLIVQIETIIKKVNTSIN